MIAGRTEYALTATHFVDLPGFDVIVIPPGFRTDLGSIPWQLQWLIRSDDPAMIAASIPHDWLYRTGSTPRWTRWACDAVFREILRKAGMGFCRAWLAWAAVRLFGKRSFAFARAIRY